MAAPEQDIRIWLKDAEQRDDTESIVGHLFGLGYCHLSHDMPQEIWPLTARVRGLVSNKHEAWLEASWLEALTHCYQGANAEVLWASLAQVRKVHKTMQGRVLLYRVWSRGYEARLLGALLNVTEGREQQRVIREIRRTQRKLLKERWYYAHSVARSMEASLLLFDGDEMGAALALQETAAVHKRHGARLFAAVYDHASAKLRKDVRGIDEAECRLRDLHVVNLARMARAHAPAFYDASC